MDVYLFCQDKDLIQKCNVGKIHFINEDEKNKYIQANVSSNENYKIVPVNDISNIPFQLLSSYNIINDELVANMEDARVIFIKRIRKEREKLLAPLDVAFMRAVERGDVAKQQEIAAQKQKLRDITAHPAIDAATTLEELRDLTIDTLLSSTSTNTTTTTTTT
jgi:hypothetical protein